MDNQVGLNAAKIRRRCSAGGCSEDVVLFDKKESDGQLVESFSEKLNQLKWRPILTNNC